MVRIRKIAIKILPGKTSYFLSPCWHNPNAGITKRQCQTVSYDHQFQKLQKEYIQNLYFYMFVEDMKIKIEFDI